MDKLNQQDEIEDIKCKRKYMLINEGYQEMLLFIDLSGKIIDTNQVARNELLYNTDLLGTNIASIFRNIFFAYNDFLEDLKNANGQRIETIAFRKNETCFPVYLRIIIESNGEDMIGLCTASNISCSKATTRDINNARNEVEEALKIKNRFIANITHELRTPVNGIMGLIKNLMDTNLSNSQLELVNLINRCCNDMTKNINELLDFSKMEAGKLSIEKQRFDFKQFIRNTIEFNSNQIYDKGLKLIVNIGNDIPVYLIGDELRLTQVLNNLLSNAIKFTTVGYISLEVTKTMTFDNKIELFFMVVDTGIGIDESDKDKLFHSFSQVDGSITRRFGGTGLGLAISKKLLELMDGSIYVNSQKGKGSIFAFSIKLGVADMDECQDVFPIVEEKLLFTYDHMLKELMEKEPLVNEVEKQPGTQGNIPDIITLMERLTISIEMGNWEKAESFASAIKCHIKDTDHELIKKAFRLELTVRKAEYDKALQLLSQLKAMIDEMR